MREAAFVRQNKEKWTAFEKALQQGGGLAPDALADGYIHLTNDLAYAQTYYPGSKTLEYLNALASEAHQIIYRNRKESRNRLWRYWTHEFPHFFGPHQRTLGLALLIFVLAAAIGSLSALNDASFVRLILGDAYVNLTLDNIAQGNPTAIYKSGGALGSFLGITIHNIRVALLAYALGVTAGIGTAYLLFNNGVMVGAFITFFYNEGVFVEANKQIWLHGAFELSVIVVAGCAGLLMGKGLLFPGTYPRRHSFMQGAKDGLKVLVSTLPFFVVAGFIEGFITRYSEMPLWLALILIAACFGLILFYYFIYPRYLNTTHAKPSPTPLP
ncbi:stage II sporulation protein M [Robiginitalea sp. M366]|uniref:stage II sporulation protein M n=1 Tax=Robiginitalea aestuariiviva TaxID=3036903 RepID=UPI00240DD372|nr:stage II sporulation protein M [Robiginitalea aestuariiviva]MDG1572571.1 stage II sporulation protein M [Robiginitalea aestuariiviva]